MPPLLDVSVPVSVSSRHMGKAIHVERRKEKHEETLGAHRRGQGRSLCERSRGSHRRTAEFALGERPTEWCREGNAGQREGNGLAQAADRQTQARAERLSSRFLERVLLEHPGSTATEISDHGQAVRPYGHLCRETVQRQRGDRPVPATRRLEHVDETRAGKVLGTVPTSKLDPYTHRRYAPRDSAIRKGERGRLSRTTS